MDGCRNDQMSLKSYNMSYNMTFMLVEGLCYLKIIRICALNIHLKMFFFILFRRENLIKF